MKTNSMSHNVSWKIDIWDDSLCSVEDKYICHTSSKALNSTCQFKNSFSPISGEIQEYIPNFSNAMEKVQLGEGENLKNNIKDIKEIKKISTPNLKENSESIAVPHSVLSVKGAFQKSKSSPSSRYWKKLCEELKEVDSPRILSTLKDQKI